MSGQKKKGFRVASGQYSVFINASASQEVHGAEPCVIGQTPLYAYDVFITFVLQSAPMSKGSDTYIYLRGHSELFPLSFPPSGGIFL
jgi:hypothetical protein